MFSRVRLHLRRVGLIIFTLTALSASAQQTPVVTKTVGLGTLPKRFVTDEWHLWSTIRSQQAEEFPNRRRCPPTFPLVIRARRNRVLGDLGDALVGVVAGYQLLVLSVDLGGNGVVEDAR